VSALLWNLRLAVRTWCNAPLLALTAVTTLALGIGVTTAVYSVASGALFNVVPYGDPARSVEVAAVRLQQSDAGQGVAPATFLDWREQAAAFEGLAAFEYAVNNLTDGDDGGVVAVGPRISATALSLFGVDPLIGRVFTAEDAEPGAEPVAILSHGLWERRYGADRDLIGATIEIDQVPVRVVGVLRRNEFFPYPDAELVRPLTLLRSEASRSERSLGVLGVLAPGVSIAQAQSEMDVISERLAQQYPESERGWTVRVRSLAESAAGGARTRGGVALLMGAVALVLLIVCANVANLLLSRGASRTKELATRCAVGASRAQIAGQLLLESIVLAAVAFPVALLIGRAMLELFLSMVPASFGWMETVFRFDRPVWIFALAVTGTSAVLFGLAPALQASRVDLQGALKEGGGRGATASRPWVRAGLAVGQLAFAVSLLSTSALVIESFAALQARDPGIDAERLLVTSVDLPAQRYPTEDHWREFQRSVLAGLAAAPGVEAASTVNFIPFGFPGPRLGVEIEGREVSGDEPIPEALSMTVSVDYFETLGLRLLGGRLFGPEDRAGGVPVVVVNDTFARRYLGAMDPIGVRLEIAGERREVVGVVSDYHNVGLRDPAEPQTFVPVDQRPHKAMGVLVRASGEPTQLAATVRGVFRRVDGGLPIVTSNAMTQIIRDQIWTARFLEQVMLVLSAVALVLAGLGVYAVVSYAASQRAQEFAIRSALGADPSRMAQLVLRQVLVLVTCGTALGLGICLLISGFLERLLYIGKGWEPAQFALIVLGLGVVALVASGQPALRAIRTDPMDALRAE